MWRLASDLCCVSILKQVPGVAALGRKVRKAQQQRRFNGSADYWESRYRDGGNSGGGSYGRLAKFKAETLNNLVMEKGVRSVVELGCGDGAQLELAAYPQYTGVDVAPTSIEQCRKRFADDPTKAFVLLDELDKVGSHDLAMSLDVVYHLIEDDTFEAHMRDLFRLGQRVVVVYASNVDAPHRSVHVRHRRFTDWVERNEPGWSMTRHVPNPYPAEINHETADTSWADFYVFERV